MGEMVLHSPMRAIRFDAFTLNLSRCTLHRGDDELSLRPKSFDVLRCLLERPGRVVEKDELIEAAWPGISVTDDSPVQCVMDIRNALGEDGRKIIKTVPRRGYLVDVQVSEVDLVVDQPPVQALQPSNAPVRVLARSAPINSALTAAYEFIVYRHRRAVVVGVLFLLGAAFAASFLHRPAPMSKNVVHQTMLATATFEKERSPKSYREAFALFAKAIDMDPDFVPALLGYAQVIIVGVTEHWAPPREQDMRLNLAEAAIERALSLEPRNPRALRVKGFLFRARGQPDRAIPLLEKARALSPNDPWVYADLGRAEIDAGRAIDAIADLETAMRLSPDNPASYVWYYQAGMAAVHARKPETALDWLQKSEQTNPAYLQSALLWRAVANADLGREETARGLLARYIGNAPSFTVAAWNQHFQRPNASMATQRARIADVLRRLGLPEGEALKTGSTH